MEKQETPRAKQSLDQSSYDWITDAQRGAQNIAVSTQHAVSGLGKSLKFFYQLYLEEQPTERLALTVVVLACVFILVYVSFKKCEGARKSAVHSGNSVPNITDLTYSWSVFDLAKTAYEPGHTEAVINIIEKLHYDVNAAIPSNGLTMFLCACLSGKRELINYMISKGADIHRTTKAGDTALYLATFGILSSPSPDTGVLEDLVIAGCDINRANGNRYTALHRAAGHGDLKVIQMLLKHGADPYQKSISGIYPMDSAINAGNLEAAALLKISISNPYVWDVVDPHTPPSIKLGLQSPQRKHLMESSRRVTSPRII